jgi:hypothetical protein
MRLAALRHTEVAGELAAFWAAVSSAAVSVLGRSPGNTSRVEVVGELVTEFQKVEGRRSKLEWPTARIYDLLLRPPPGRAWLAGRLDEATGQLRVELVMRQEAEAELEALRSLVARFQCLVLDDTDRSSLLAVSMSMVAEWLESWIDAAAAHGVRWGSNSVLVADVSHFSELDVDLEVRD